jgi:hypothetical protein
VRGLRVEGTHRRAGAPKLAQQGATGGFAHVVGVRLERQTPHRERLAAQRGFAAVVADDQLEQMFLLALVHRLHRVQQLGTIAVLLRGARQRLHVFREAGTAVAGARVDEMPADPRVGADALTDHFHVGTDLLRDVRDLVHEADLGRQHRVGGVLGQLGGAHVHHHDAVVVAIEGGIQRLRLDKLAGLRLHRLDGGGAAARGRRDQAALHSQPPGGWNLPREFEPLNHPAVCADGSLTN